MNSIWSRKHCFGAVVLSLFAFVANAGTLEIVTASPKAYEPVLMRFAPNGGLVTPPWRVRMNANRITVYVEPAPAPLLPPGPFWVYANLGSLPAGNYAVEVVVKLRYEPSNESLQGAMEFVVADAAQSDVAVAPLNTFTDLWWNPAESGWGINITVKKGMFFAAWFVYDAAGRAAWLTLQGGGWAARNCYQGSIIRTTGPALGGILALNSVNFSPVGTGQICFNDDNSARFTYTVDGIANEKTIYRQPF